MPGTGLGIQVGSARGAKSTTVGSTQWTQRNLQQKGVAQHRFEVGIVSRQLVSVLVFTETKDLGDIDCKRLFPFDQTPMTRQAKVGFGGSAHHEHTRCVLENQIDMKRRTDCGAFETPRDRLVEFHRASGT